MARGTAAAALLAALALRAVPALADTVVFNEGLGSGKRAFASVIAALAPDVPVFYQPRPDHMPGDEDGRRSPSDIARNLHDRLAAAGVVPPYVMVGHSLGGSYALAYARLYPDEVSGLLLLDPRLPSYTPACIAAHQVACDFPPLLLKMLPASERMEYLGLPDDAALLADARGVGPLTVLGATVAQAGVPADWQVFWLAHLQGFAATAAKGRFVPVPGASHMIQKLRPDVVATEIRRLLPSR